MATIIPQKRKTQLSKPVEVVWDSFRRGLNLLLQDRELQKEESRKLDNLILKGAGILTQRPGTANYFLAGSGKVRGLFPYYDKAGTNSILALTDEGYLVKKNNSSYTIIPGASFPSGTDVSAAQIYNKLFISSKTVNLRRYDGTTLTPYIGISTPTSLTATKSSGATGAFTWYWRVSAESDVGETLASNAVSVSGLPEDLTTIEYVRLSWATVAGAKGYVIYGREAGNESFLSRVPATSTEWIDDGNNVPSLSAYPPEADFTAGPKGKIIIAFREKLVVGNLDGNPSRIMGSGGGPNVDKFHWSKGGFYVDINKDDGQEVEGLIEFENRIIVWKTRSIYQVTLGYNSSLGIVEPTVQKINNAVGCVSWKTVVPVENDVFFMGRRAGGGISLNSLGYEPNFTTVLRTSEVSPRIRPEMEKVNMSRVDEMWALYWKNIYWLFYPVGTNSMRCIGYDRERLAFLGPFDFPNAPAYGTIFYDTDKSEHVLYGDGDDGYVTEISPSYSNDKGKAFTWTFQSKKEELGDGLRLKNLISYFLHVRNVSGTISVSIDVEDTRGLSTTAANFEISSNQVLAGFGSFGFGLPKGSKTPKWGYQPSTGTTNSADVIKYLLLNKNMIRSYQITIKGTNALADIVQMKSILIPLSSGSIPQNWKI